MSNAGMRTGRRRLAALFALTTLLQPVWADTITTAQITAETVSAIPGCLQWRLSGVCFWLRCTPVGCSVVTSERVTHYNPDLVVSSYRQVGENPWTEIRATLGVAQKTVANTQMGVLAGVPVGGGEATEGRAARDHQTTVYFEADAIGHPLSMTSQFAGATGLLCPSAAEPMVPYFQSALDAVAWRSGIPESIYYQALTPGIREIGDWPGNTWGSVYPRSGFLAQPEYPKAAAVIAQRAADIVSRPNQPHVYQPISTSRNVNGVRVWHPDPASEGDANAARWQMHLPVASRSCAAFGVDDRFSGLSGWAAGKGSRERGYVWTQWRLYQCCRRRGSYLHSVTW